MSLSDATPPRAPANTDEAIPASAARLFEKNGRTFLFDACHRQWFELDPAERAAVRILFGEERDTACAGATADEVEAAVERLSALREKGYFRDYPVMAPPFDPRLARVTQVILSRRCNLACRYCFRRSDRSSAPETMSREIMEATAEFAAERAATLGQACYLVLGGTSEIALSLPERDAFVALLARHSARRGISSLAISPLSNFAFHDRPDFLERLQQLGVCCTSLDGPPQAHDALRVHPDGRGSYQEVRWNAALLRERGHHLIASAVLTSLYTDIPGIYAHLFGLGFQHVGLKPVRSRPGEPWAIGRGLAAICDGYDRFAEGLLALDDAELLRRLMALRSSEVDYFSRFLARIFEQQALVRRCPAGVEELTVNTDGRLYLCPSLAGAPEACAGSVWEGVDDSILRRIYESMQGSKREPCNRCWARLICGGGCLYQSLLTHSRFEPPDPAECQLNKHLVELAIWMQAELRRTRPRVLTALPRLGRSSWTELEPVLCQRVSHQEDVASWTAVQQQEPSATIPVSKHLRGRLPGPGDEGQVEIRLGWDPARLDVLITVADDAPDARWGRVDHIQVRFSIPAGASGRQRSVSPPAAGRMQNWTVQLAPPWDGPQYGPTPTGRFDGQPIPDGRHAFTSDGCYLSLSWASLGADSPDPGSEFGLQIQVHNGEGGYVEWFTEHDGGRIRLASPDCSAPLA